jgi:hypothetical protein
MSTITASPAVEEVLSKLEEPTEIRDSNGNLIGRFTPARFHAKVYQDAAARFDPVEMKRRRESQQQGYTTNEVLNHLKSLDSA